MTTPLTDRPREAPAARLAPAVGIFNLRSAAEELEQEPRPAAHGHRQKVLARHGGTTIALFVFEAGASLRPHSAGGTITIQCVDGELELTADDAKMTLRPGDLLALAPHVLHGVLAVQRSIMLVTVAVQAAPGASA